MSKWTKEEVEYLSENYGVASPQEIENHLDKNWSTIRNYAKRHGIVSQRRWTKEEEELLEALHGRFKYKTIARKLGRTENAIWRKTQSMGLGEYKAKTDAVCVNYVAYMLGKPQKVVFDWTKKDLKSVKRGRYRMIERKTLFKWLESHPEKWSAMKCTEKWFFENESWFQEKMKQEIHEKYDIGRWKQ